MQQLLKLLTYYIFIFFGLKPCLLFQSVTTFHLQEAVQSKGLRDDTTCIVVDILPQEKISPPDPPPRKAGMGVFKAIFGKKSSESPSCMDRGYSEPSIVEEIFEDGSAVLAQRSICLAYLLSSQNVHSDA